MLGVLALVGGIFLVTRDAEENEDAEEPAPPKPIVLGGGQHAADDTFDTSSRRWIGPGSRRGFVLSTFFPVLHPDSFQPTLESKYKPAENGFSKQHLDVDVGDARIEPSSVHVTAISASFSDIRSPQVDKLLVIYDNSIVITRGNRIGTSP